MATKNAREKEPDHVLKWKKGNLVGDSCGTSALNDGRRARIWKGKGTRRKDGSRNNKGEREGTPNGR